MDDHSPAVGPLEAAILHVLWTRGAASASEVVAALPPGKRRHVNTVGTVLSRLARRGIVTGPVRIPGIRGGRFAAAITREELARRCVASVRRELFGGSLRGLLAALVTPVAGGRKGRRSPLPGDCEKADHDLVRRALRALDEAAPAAAREDRRRGRRRGD
jgi:predicted transcriptional regulator